MPPSRSTPCVLSIAGSDSGGGAGIQADLKAFAACGVHGMTAITAVTAQNTQEVREVQVVPPATIRAQVEAVRDDIGLDAVKIGMLGTSPTIEAVAELLDELDPSTPVVLDPVMVAESGARLLDADARAALVELLLPRATVVTPNVSEARVLAGREDGVEELARAILGLGPGCVVVTGGHREEVTDLFWDGELIVEIPGAREPAGAAHGSGCTHSSALAAHLALGADPLEASRRARELAGRAVRDGLRDLGGGAGPVDALGLATRARREEPRSSGIIAS
jgi:hydroxymethylpyrimidine/phosphomethylpyrimidine kinase